MVEQSAENQEVLMAAKSSSAEATAAGATSPCRGPVSALRSLKRTLFLETVSKSVTERKESSKQIMDQATGSEKRRDSHIETSTTEEVHTKRQEETVESYDSTAPPTTVHTSTTATPLEGLPSHWRVGSHGQAASQPNLINHDATPLAAGTSAPDIHEVSSSGRKKVIKPVAIRVQDDERIEESVVSPEEQSSSSMHSILRSATSHEEAANKPTQKLEWQEQEDLKPTPPPLFFPRIQLTDQKSAEEDEDDEISEPPPARLNLRRKDSIAVTKLRMLKQQDLPLSEEDETEEGQGTQSPDQKHPTFRPPTVISILSEQAEDASTSEAPSEPYSELVSPRPDIPVATSTAARPNTSIFVNPPAANSEPQAASTTSESPSYVASNLSSIMSPTVEQAASVPLPEDALKEDVNCTAVSSAKQSVATLPTEIPTRTHSEEITTEDRSPVRIESSVSEGTLSAGAQKPETASSDGSRTVKPPPMVLRASVRVQSAVSEDTVSAGAQNPEATPSDRSLVVRPSSTMLVATVVDDMASNVKTPMDANSKNTLLGEDP